MTRRRTASTAATVATVATVDDPALAEDRRFATLHLRLGQLSLARAELDDLHRRGALDDTSLADLAEARWRTDDADGAAAAAADHLASGGRRPIALVIAAETAAAAGRPGEASAHVEAVRPIDALTLDALFAGMPRRAFWPSALSEPVVSPAALTDAVGSHHRAGPAPAMAGLWGDEPPDGAGAVEGTAGAASAAFEAPASELDRARAELGSDDPEDAARGLARLALLLRLDPTLAPAVIGAVGIRRDVGALLVRGDANRLLGRHLEAEAAFAAAGRALDSPDRRGRT
jgi:hypothetical protein